MKKAYKSKTKFLITALLVLAMAMVFTACGDDEKEAGGDVKADTENSIIYASNDYTRINPAIDEHGEINLLIFDGLMGHDKDNNVVPALAEKYDLDNDTNTYTFKLRRVLSGMTAKILQLMTLSSPLIRSWIRTTNPRSHAIMKMLRR